MRIGVMIGGMSYRGDLDDLVAGMHANYSQVPSYRKLLAIDPGAEERTLQYLDSRCPNAAGARFEPATEGDHARA